MSKKTDFQFATINLQFFLVFLLFVPVLHAQEPPKPERAPREIFVPFGDLHVLLEQPPQRVMLSRDEYDNLLKKAIKTTETHAPQQSLVVSADYDAKLGNQRAEIVGKLGIDVLEDGLFALPLDIGDVGLRSAKLDGKGAALGRSADGPLQLFVEGKGRHELQLEMVAPVTTTAAKQRLQYRLPRPAVAKIQLTVPGDVEIKSGTAVVSRTVETTEKEKLTRFELLPQEGEVMLDMSLNSHLQRQSRAVAVRSVLVDEVTEGYEKLHATVSLEILYQPMDQFRFAVPDGFEITEINSPLLARWDVQEVAGKKVVNVKLREHTTETVVLGISALGTPSRLGAWRTPKLQPLPLDDGPSDVISQAAIVGLLVEDRLKPESLDAEGLIAIDATVIGKALPASLAHPAPGTPLLVPVAAYYAPEEKFELSGKFIKPPVEMAVSTSLLWRVSDRGYEILGGFTLLPRGERLFSFDFSTPPEWTITTITGAEEKPLKFDCYSATDKAGRVRVYVPQGMPADREFKVNFQAVRTPQSWLADWKPEKSDIPAFKDSFPAFTVIGATRDEGAIAVEVRDDITVRPETLKALIPLDNTEKANYGLEGMTLNLGYRYENPQYAAAVIFERTSPRLSARTFSFLQISPEGLNAHYELIYNIEEARTQNLTLLLPANTPTALSIRGLDGVVVKEFTADTPRLPGEGQGVRADQHRWKVLLAEPRRGKVRLAVDFQKLLPGQEPKKFALPVVAAEGVVYQSGLVAVEGCAEFEVQVTTTDRKVDVGELVDADYQPGRRLLGVYGFAGNPPEVSIDVSRNPSYPIYSALAQKALLTTHLSPDGDSHTEAVFTLRTKAQFVELQLPAGSELWSSEIDSMPIKPQREGKSVLLGLPAAAANTLHMLKIVYRTPTFDLGLQGKINLAGPKLFLRADRDTTAIEVPLADLEWKLCLPSGYEVIRSTGTLTTDELAWPRPAAVILGNWIYDWSGGVGHGLLTELQSAREAARRGAVKSAGEMGYEYGRKSEDLFMRRPPATEAKSEAPPSPAPATAAHPSERPAEPAAPEMTPPLPSEEAIRKPTDSAPEKKDAERLRDQDQAKLPQSDLDSGNKPVNPSDINGIPSGNRRAGSLLLDLGEVEQSAIPFDSNVPITSPDAKKWEKLSSDRRKAFDKLTGVRSLKIELEKCPGITFRSLGEEPLLQVELADRQRFDMLGWGIALAAFLFGAAMTRRSPRAKIRYVVLLALIATIVPAVWDCIATAWICNLLFFAACLLVPYYLLVGLVRWTCVRCCRRSSPVHVPNATLAAVSLIILTSTAWESANAQDPTKPNGSPYVIQVVEPAPPVSAPEDAIVIPYDPDSAFSLSPEAKAAQKKSDKLLLPYEKYVELWNRANPDKKIETKKPPTEFALSGASYKTTLGGDEYLLVVGELEIDVYTNEYVQIPLGLNGGVLAAANLDGKPARLSSAALPQSTAQQAAQYAQPQQVSRADNAPNPIANAQNHGVSDVRFFVLTLQGKGHHKLEISVRMKVSRDGGWRSVDGLLPAAPASACTIVVPLAPAELRFSRLSDRQSYDVEKPGETISTALGPGGSLAVRWRAKAAAAKVDLALTARSDAALDVQEDGLRWTWMINLDFRGKTLEEFEVDVPAMYVVEKVEGGNIRGWQAEKNATGQTVKITLLKAAKDREQIVLVLSKAAAIGQGSNKEFSVDLVQLKQAALHTGRILIRRSPLLDVRTLDRAGMTRSDIPEDLPKLVGVEKVESPLNIQPFEAYRFDRNPAVSIRLAADPTQAKMTATVQSVLKIADANRTLDSRIMFQIQDRAAYRLQIYLPDDFRLDRLGLPGEFEYSIASKNERRLLTIFMTAGRTGELPVIVRGALGRQTGMDKVPLPRLEVLGVERQQGDIAVQASDAYDVDAFDLKNCEKALLDRLFGWLKPEQQSLTRLAVQYREGDYSGALKLVHKNPEVDCETFSNVRVTERAIEETILFDYTIKNAGVRKFSFFLPWWMKNAKISVPMLREKSNEPLEAGEKSPRLVKIELQDEAIGQHRVLVENDRQLEEAPQEAPIPKVNDVRSCRRYVTLESYGRDEILVEGDKLVGMEKLIQGQKEWEHLKDLRGNAVTYAYLVSLDAQQPKLVYRSNVRTAVQTAGARIGLVKTILQIDENGAYRAMQAIKIFNSTEQFLEIELPVGAQLWTVLVAGESVKPVKVAKGDPRGVLIPLVKTAAGDLDYQIILNYGGKMPEIGNFSTVAFPLARTVNISPELSQVQLHVPKDRQWFDFGGTMRLVEQADLLAGEVADETKQIGRLRQTMQESSNFAKIRAAENMKQIGLGLHNYHDASRYIPGSNEALEKELAGNKTALDTARKEVAKIEVAPQSAEVRDNRGKLREYFYNQTNAISGQLLAKAESNWGDTTGGKESGGEKQASGEKQSLQFNDAWLARNSLSSVPAKPTENVAALGKDLGVEKKGQVQKGGYGGRSEKTLMPGKPSAAQVAQGKSKHQLEQSNAQLQIANGTFEFLPNRNPNMDEQDGQEERYKARYAQQQIGGQNPSSQTMQSFGMLSQSTLQSANPPAQHEPAQVLPEGVMPGYSQGMPGMTPQALPSTTPQTPGSVPGAETNPHGAREAQPSIQGGLPVLPAATGLASLDIQLTAADPNRWTTYCFTTPRGETKITARSISHPLLSRWGFALGIVAVIFFLGFLARRWAYRGYDQPVHSSWAVLLIVLGVLSVLAGVLPILGVIAIIAGIALAISNAGRRNVAA